MELGSNASHGLLAAVFAVHNAEELTFLNRGGMLPPALAARFPRLEGLYGRRRLAPVMLALTGAVAAVLSSRRPGATALHAAAAGALGANALVHIGRAAAERRYNPGAATAPALLGAAALHLVVVREHGPGKTAAAAVLGALLMPAGIAAALAAGHGVTLAAALTAGRGQAPPG